MAICGFGLTANAATFDKFSEDGALAVPWHTEFIEAIDAYVPSPHFNGGRLSLDHFASANSADISGGVTAELPGGDIVVAGLVSRNTTTGLWNLGLVRYSPTGVRRTWTNPVNGFYFDQYAIYPSSATPKFQYIRDIKVHNGIIYVLVDEQQQNQAGLGRQNVRIVAFRTDGSLLDDEGVFGYSFSTDPDDFYGSQMVPVSNTRMMVVALTYDNVGPYVSVTRMTIDGAGALVSDNTWGTAYGGSCGGGICPPQDWLIRYYAPSSLCVSAPCNAIPGYATKAVGLATNDFYVAGSVQYNGGNDWDTFVLKISSDTGDVKPEFSGDGWARYGFDQTNSNFNDRAGGLYVYQDDIWLAAHVAQKCHAGIGMAKINGATGSVIPAFGATGKIVFGGQGNVQFCFGGSYEDKPYAISATAGRIGVVGHQTNGMLGSPYDLDPMLAVVDAVGGAVLDHGRHPIRRADGSRMGDGVFYSVYGGPSAMSPFTAAGTGRDAAAGNTLSYLTGRLIPVSADRIFASGFD